MEEDFDVRGLRRVDAVVRVILTTLLLLLIAAAVVVGYWYTHRVP